MKLISIKSLSAMATNMREGKIQQQQKHNIKTEKREAKACFRKAIDDSLRACYMMLTYEYNLYHGTLHVDGIIIVRKLAFFIKLRKRTT